MKIIIEKTPEDYDSDNVRFDVDGEIKGFGFIPKKGEPDHDGMIRLTKCPECRRENYAMAVVTGCCAWCGFNANKVAK